MNPRAAQAAATALAGLAVSLVALAQPAPTQVGDPRPLMLAALAAPEGTARGILAGASADAITARFRASAPIHVEVRTLRRLAQAGCARLQVRLWQDGVQLPGATDPRRASIDFGVDYCSDGSPPRRP